MSDSLRDRISKVIQSVDDWRGVTDPTILADQIIDQLGLRYQYENGRVMYNVKPAACKGNGNWQVRIVSPHVLYEED
jgi:hypothetical protein